MTKISKNGYITSWGLQQSITNKIPTTERLRLYKHWKKWVKSQKERFAKSTNLHPEAIP